MNRVFKKQYNMLLLLHRVAPATQYVRCKHMHIFIFFILFFHVHPVSVVQAKSTHRRRMSPIHRREEKERERGGGGMRGDAKSGMYVGGEKRSLGFSLSIPRKKRKRGGFHFPLYFTVPI